MFGFALEHNWFAVKCLDAGGLFLPQPLNLLLLPINTERHLGLMDIFVPRFCELGGFFP